LPIGAGPTWNRAWQKAGANLVRRVYQAENDRDIDAYLSCFASPWLHHIFGRPIPMGPDSRTFILSTLGTRDAHDEIEEIVSIGDRVAVRFHIRFVGTDGAPISQHGCKIYEHDGQRITRDWAYWPNLGEFNPSVSATTW